MNDGIISNIASKKQILIYANCNGFSLSLAEKFLANRLCVNILSENPNDWFSATKHLRDNIFFKIIITPKLPLYNIDIALFLSSLLNGVDLEDDNSFEDFEKQRLNHFKKIIDVNKYYLLPLTIRSRFAPKLTGVYEEATYPLLKNIGVIYLGDLFGPRMALSQHNPAVFLLTGNLNNHFNTQDGLVFPTYIPRAASAVVKVVLKGGGGIKIRISGNKTAAKTLNDLVATNKFGSEQISQWPIALYDKKIILKVKPQDIADTMDWLNNNQRSNKDKKNLIRHLNTKKPTITPAPATMGRASTDETQQTNKTLPNLKIPTIKLSISKIRLPKLVVKKRLKIPQNKPPRLSKKSKKGGLVFGISLAITVTILPIILFMFSLLVLGFGGYQLKHGHTGYSQKAFIISEHLGQMAGSQFDFMNKLPVAGPVFDAPSQYARILTQTAKAGKTTAKIADEATRLLSKTLTGKNNEVEASSRFIALELEALYREFSFLSSEIYSSDLVKINKLKKFFDKMNLDEKRNEIEAGKTVVENLPELLGVNQTKTYVLLFQNNMELRPTGGFIGSFAVVKFESGALADINVIDVYSADGQLKGHVEPPWQIKSYLNEAGWYLRDVNWDPDFTASAEKAEWFLDKEMDIAADGVIAIDLNFIKDILDVIGPIELSDYQKSIDSRNFYEITQYEVEKDFFPGSRKKANFIMAMASRLLMEIKNLDKKDYYPLFNYFYQNLHQRHIQLFLHNNNLQQQLSRLGWDGAIAGPGCSQENCAAELIAVIEANFGVNKANYFVQRDMAIKTSVEGGTIKNSLEILIKNSANPSLGLSGIYKNYLRLITLPGSVFEEVNIKGGGEDFTARPIVETNRGKVEAGVYVEVLPQQEKKIIFNWTKKDGLDVGKNGEMRFLIRKQAGVDQMGLSVKVDFPQGMRVGADAPLLTKGASVGYNTLLTRDLFARIYW